MEIRDFVRKGNELGTLLDDLKNLNIEYYLLYETFGSVIGDMLAECINNKHADLSKVFEIIESLIDKTPSVKLIEEIGTQEVIKFFKPLIVLVRFMIEIRKHPEKFEDKERLKLVSKFLKKVCKKELLIRSNYRKRIFEVIGIPDKRVSQLTIPKPNGLKKPVIVPKQRTGVWRMPA